MTAMHTPLPSADTSVDSVGRQHDAASYIAAITFELRQIAMAAGLTEIMVPLEQVYYQAWSVAERQDHAQEHLQPKVNG